MIRRSSRISKIRRAAPLENYKIKLSDRRRKIQESEEPLEVSPKNVKNNYIKTSIAAKILNKIYWLIIISLLLIIGYLLGVIYPDYSKVISSKYAQVISYVQPLADKYIAKIKKELPREEEPIVPDSIESKEISYDKNTPTDFDIERQSTADPEKVFQPFDEPKTETETETVEPKVVLIPNEPVKIAIIIDDMGIDKYRTKEIIALDKEITVSFLPYSSNLAKYVDMAYNAGHEIMAHIPMEPENSKYNPGPDFLNVNMDELQIRAFLDAQLAKMPYAVGINNHMGSKFTADFKEMSFLMDYMKDKPLFFIDSLTSKTSKAAFTARQFNINYAVRDVFIDHTSGKDSALKQLQKTEMIASKKGYAIAIGHPRDATIEALKLWIPTLPQKGIKLVPISDIIQLKTSNLR